MKLNIEPSVTVITPTIGKAELSQAIDSVLNQTYKTIKHLVVIDGQEYVTKALAATTHEQRSNDRVVMMGLPFNTGKNGFNGQRIYAAMPHLIDSDYILFLDEDNWYEPNHVKSLIDTMQQNQLDFAYSLRKIHNVAGDYVINDDCESLGQWPIWFTANQSPHYLIDTSAYAFTNSFIRQTAHLWHSGIWGEDRRFLAAVRERAKFKTSGEYTLCYRLGGNPNSVNEGFFIEGNEYNQKYYNGVFPWQKK